MAATLLVVVACGPSLSQSAQSPSPSPSHGPLFVDASPAVPPCALLTGDELSALAGTQVAQLSGGGQVPRACQFADEAATSEVTVLIHTYTDRASARADFDALSEGYKQEGSQAVPVAGVGDEAAIFHFEAVDSIIFAKGLTFVGIAVEPVASDDALTTAASAAAGRLP